MKIFIDTANLAEIKEGLSGRVIEGITTNPSLLAKEPKGNYLEHMKKVIDLARPLGLSVSVEVFSTEPAEMIKQAEEFSKELDYENLAVKIPVSYKSQAYFSVIKELADAKIAVNATACMAPMQGAMAAKAGARYVSIFYNRLRDGSHEEQFSGERKKALEEGIVEITDFDPNAVIAETKRLMEGNTYAEIIVGSIRTTVDVKQAFLAGAHIVTMPPKIIKAAGFHFKTDDAVERFLKDFSAWIS